MSPLNRCVGLYFLGLSITACAPAKPPALPVAEWRFVDADTGKGIPGVWINFFWNGKPTERGMSTCMRGVLAQSDQDGWVRDTAREAHWTLRPLPHWFKGGYETFLYQITKADRAANTITAFVRQDRTELGAYPAWEEKLKALGYVWEENRWIKTLPRGDFVEPYQPGNRKIRYLMTYRSTPPDAAQFYSFVGTVCADPGAENTGLEITRVDRADRERALTSTRYFCGRDWDSIPEQFYPGFHEWILRGLWLVPSEPTSSLEQLDSEQPEMAKLYRSMSARTKLSVPLRRQFCKWVELKSGEKLL
jgi:hypothetical protein